MTDINSCRLDHLHQALASFVTNEGSGVEKMIDAYEGLAAALRRPEACTGELCRRAERFARDLNNYAASEGVTTLAAIAMMDERTVRYWATRMLGLAASTEKVVDGKDALRTEVASRGR